MVKPTALGLFLLSALTQHAWGADSDWQLASRVDLAPRSTLVVLVHQQGVDLAVRLRSAHGVVHEQDGPDVAVGTEVLLLRNPSASSSRYEIFVRPMFQGPAPRFEIEQFPNPTRSEQTVAKALSDLSQQWLSGAPAKAVLPLVKNETALRPGRFRDFVVNACVDVLVRSGQSADVVEFLRQESAAPDSRVAIVDRVYRNYQLTNALWGAMQIDAALKAIEAVSKEIATSAQWRSSVPAPTRRWLDVSVDTLLGAIRIFAGRMRNDRKLIEEGGDLLAATLRSVSNDPDYSLRARLTEYLAGYYNFILDRSNDVTSELYRQAEHLYERAGDRLSISSIRNNQAYAELGRGNVEAALRLYLETLELQQTSRHLEGQAHVRARLGYLYYTIGDYRRAEIRFRESIEIYKEIKLSLKVIHTQLQLAELLHADNRSAEALTLLEEVRATRGSQPSIEDRLRLMTQLAAIRVDRGDIKAAERTLAELGALDRFDSRNWTSLQVSVRLFFLLDFEIVRARIELANGALLPASRRIERALAWLGEGRREPLQQLQLLHLQLVILEQGGDEQRFAKTGDRALALIESIRGSIDFHTQGPAWTARTSDISNLLVSHHLSRYESGGHRADFERAFSLLETVRARNLRDVRAVITAHREIETSDRAGRELQRANQELIGALLLEQSSEPLERRLAKAEEQYQLNNRATRTARTPLAVLDSDSIRRRLDPQTQVRVLFAGKSSSYAIVLTRDAVNAIRLPGEADLTALVAASVRELGLRGRDLSRTRALAQLLFPTERGASTPSRMLVESDGVFAAIPFSILLDLQAQGKSPPSVTVVPSLSEMFGADVSAAARPSPAKGRKELVIFADPAFALSTQAEGSSAWRQGFARLPYSQVEAKAISAYFSNEAVVTFIDKDATIGNIIGESARTARVLHIAAHGFASANDPLLVGLGLAKDSDNSGSGLLTTQHISEVHYENELIVVSACESGQGQLLDGEGLMSVARSFLASGAKATLSTLWPVPDRANAEFMKEFYFSLTQLRNDPAASLVHAQQKMKSSRQFNHPYFWGSFVLHVVDGRYSPIDGAVPVRAATKGTHRI